MKDKMIERQVKNLKDFIALWVKFREICHSAAGEKDIADHEEELFLQVQSQVARNYQTILEVVGIKPIGDRTFSVISRVPSLKDLKKMNPDEKDMFEKDWHNSYIELNRLIGSLEAKQQELARISTLSVFSKQYVSNSLLQFVILAALIAAIYYVVKARNLEPVIKEWIGRMLERFTLSR